MDWKVLSNGHPSQQNPDYQQTPEVKLVRSQICYRKVSFKIKNDPENPQSYYLDRHHFESPESSDMKLHMGKQM